MSEDLVSLLLSILKIIWIDLLLSGDNAVVIALACRNLPEHQKRMGILLGSGAAIALRLVFTLVIVELIALPYIKLMGGLLLFWIAVRLLQDGESEHHVKSEDTLRKAVQTIAIADGVMSLDNVLAIVAAAKGSIGLIIFGLLLSMPLIIFGSALILRLIARFPQVIWAGAALLGWIGAEMILSDGWVAAQVAPLQIARLDLFAGVAGALLVLGFGFIINKTQAKAASGT